MLYIQQIVRENQKHSKGGIYSVCSASPFVLEAAMLQAMRDNTYLLIESTSNQVNQYGGYTGKTPEDFRNFCDEIAASVGLDRDRLILGGDHLGPNCWQNEPAGQAMEKSRELIREYVKAGFQKIHLDASMSCADDPSPLPDAVVAERAADLCAVAEQQALDSFGSSQLLYVVGTEVPVPGGAQEDLDTVAITTPERARTTLDHHYKCFMGLGLEQAWKRVVGLVVQPGVEFDHVSVIDYQACKAEGLSRFIEDFPGMVFEAHSTDYQKPEAYKELVRDHFAILKVGPQLTWAMREALFALAAIEKQIVPVESRSYLPDVMEQVMLSEPGYWSSYYTETADRQHISRQFSYSDRIRYYWPHPKVQTAVQTLMDNLSRTQIPLPLLSQYLPLQYLDIRSGTLAASPKDIVIHKISQVLDSYSSACRTTLSE